MLSFGQIKKQSSKLQVENIKDVICSKNSVWAADLKGNDVLLNTGRHFVRPYVRPYICSPPLAQAAQWQDQAAQRLVQAAQRLAQAGKRLIQAGSAPPKAG